MIAIEALHTQPQALDALKISSVGFAK